MATTLPWRHPPPPLRLHRRPIPFHNAVTVRAFQRSDFDRFARDAWRTANDGFEQLIFETKKTAERIDRRYSVSRRLNSVAQSAADRFREIDRELEISVRWRTFSMDFVRNWPRYRRQLNNFLDTPLGRSFAGTEQEPDFLADIFGMNEDSKEENDGEEDNGQPEFAMEKIGGEFEVNFEES
ncbi:hypothetical protein GH714_019425 [Hevea brasiliensis]|uniref:Uncharacterized protein n=1 Tax=Hevea brasiliensis TaxID=3981 RepID=A0A6A6M174_HEVBR|nr:hypothetical protein GH714_019425 [Hevea brasiliensis]